MIVYIAGPYSPTRDVSIDEHIRRAGVLAEECWMAGVPAICPQKNTAHFNGNSDVYYLGDLEILDRCDCVLMVEGWELSFGAKMERLYAIKNNIPVFDDILEMIEYCRAHDKAVKRI